MPLAGAPPGSNPPLHLLQRDGFGLYALCRANVPAVAAARAYLGKFRNNPSVFVNSSGFTELQTLFAVLAPVVVYLLKVGRSVEYASQRKVGVVSVFVREELLFVYLNFLRTGGAVDTSEEGVLRADYLTETVSYAEFKLRYYGYFSTFKLF